MTVKKFPTSDQTQPEIWGTAVKSRQKPEPVSGHICIIILDYILKRERKYLTRNVTRLFLFTFPLSHDNTSLHRYPYNELALIHFIGFI
jgi:hypothetical protein